MVSDFLYSNFRELEICENLVILITLHSLVFQKIRELVGEIKYAYRICGLITLFMWAFLYDFVFHQLPHFTSPQWESFVAYIPTVFPTNNRYYTGTRARSIQRFPIGYTIDSHSYSFNLIWSLTLILISSVCFRYDTRLFQNFDASSDSVSTGMYVCVIYFGSPLCCSVSSSTLKLIWENKLVLEWPNQPKQISVLSTLWQ